MSNKPRLNAVETNYANTDLDLLSSVAFDALNAELSASCCQLHYEETPGSAWSACYEANQLNSDAASDIGPMLDAIANLSDLARAQLSECSKRDFNIGFHCWDSWAYNYSLPFDLLASVASAGFSLSITLYPMRNADGTPKIDPDDG